jgi:SpoVK/Ycf46/Vps4 family AAA+-type ATPase
MFLLSCTVLHPCLRWDLGLPLFWGHIQVRPCVVHSESVSLQEIELRKVSLKCSSGRQWYYPDMHDRNVQPINDELNKPLDTHLQLPVGSIVALSMEPSQSEGPSKEVLYRIVPRTSTADDLKGKVVSLQPEDMAALKSLAAEALSEDVDELERSSTDFLASTLPRPVFDSTLDALGSFFCDLRRNFPFLGILSGSTGSGKTHTALILGAVARMEHHRATLYLDCKRLQDSTTTIVQILSELDEIFASACKAKRCLVILDDLDRITPNLLGGNEGDPGARAQGANPTAIDQSKLISDRILQLLEATNLRDSSVSVIATCAGATALNTSLCEDQKTANIPTLKTGERLQLFVHMLRALKLTSVAPLSEAVFGQPTEGFRPRDLEKVAARVRRYFDVHGEASSLEEATDSILQEFISLSHMGLDKPRTKAGLSWGEIGGLFNVKKKLEATLINPMKYRAIYERAKIRLPTGVLLLGPTGCGKTALVPALAKMCKFPLISCKGPEILDKYIGASEAKIRELFKRAASVAPSILFLDELDALAPRRGSDHTGVTDRVVNQLLTFLDGVEDTSNATVYVIGASSRPDKIDPALLRPGRLEQHLFVGPPESDEEWKDLFHQIASGWSLSPLCRKHFFAERGTEELLAIVKKNPLFCPADMKAAMDTAQLNAVHRTLSTTKAEDISHIDIEVEDLRRALLSMRPCLNRDDARMLAEIYHPKGRKPNTTARQQELKTTLR